MDSRIKAAILCLLLSVFILSGLNCKKDSNDPNHENPPGTLAKCNITVDRSVKYQTIDGFGFFGACDVWWASGDLWNDSWGDLVINDLGITIWRNEWFPPSTPGVPQDADWLKQKPVVQGLKAKAEQYGVDLKFIVSVWSPPADMKWLSDFSWAGDENATRYAGPVTTKNGGTLSPEKYNDYAEWLDSCIKSHKDAGIDLYALSLQNEPLFIEPYNSCTYTTAWYCELLKNVVPAIKSLYPDIRIFGAENMLEMEGKSNNFPWFYHQAIKNDVLAANSIDILAVHGYSDGLSPTSGSELSKMWANHAQEFSVPMNKPAWMTETSGYSEKWSGSGETPGAFNLAMDIYSGLVFGDMKAWVWWQGSELAGISNYSLMSNTVCGKKYYVSKQFYRYIRPGAVRVKCSSDDQEVFAVAFEHQTKGTSTIILINSGTADKSVTIQGSELPELYKVYLTTSGDKNCSESGTVSPGAGNSIRLPGLSIATLQAGGDPL